MRPNDPLLPAAASQVRALAIDYLGSEPRSLLRHVPVETPVNLIYGAKPFVVMMASPADLEDFAIGFSFTEGLIDGLSDIRSIEIEQVAAGLEIKLTLVPDKMQRLLARARQLGGRTGCGLCGVEDFSMLPQAAQRAQSRFLPDPSAIARALTEIDAQQSLHQLTHGVHGAAWCGLEGEIVALREDVGRHNALDKLIGALLRQNISPRSGFVLITSRCSFEMVEKCAAFGAGAVVAISTPTSLAIERARAYHMSLIGIARRDGALVFDPQGMCREGM